MSQSVGMILERLTDLPAFSLPQDYDISSFQSGNERDWEEIIGESFQEPYDFAEFMASKEQYLPENVFFVRHRGRPISTATAWFMPENGQDTGRLHMVGILPAYAGKGLGAQASLAALHRMRQEGRKRADLATGTHRLAAIKTYLKLGFIPRLAHQVDRDRWGEVAETLNDERLLRILR